MTVNMFLYTCKTGCDIGFYGKNCTRCPENCFDEQCHFQFGHCVDCKDGFKGDMCEEGMNDKMF